MTEADTRADSRAAALVLGLAAALTALRLAALFLSPLQLYPDEAQYWLWSRELHWGYVSKPPMIAWLIWGSTRLGGDGEAWVRLAAPFAHLVPMLALWRVGRRLYGPPAGGLSVHNPQYPGPGSALLVKGKDRDGAAFSSFIRPAQPMLQSGGFVPQSASRRLAAAIGSSGLVPATRAPISAV